MQKVLDALGPMMAKRSAPEHIAEVVYAATTDGSDRLHYEAGADAGEMIAGRRAADDIKFTAGTRGLFALD